MEPVVEPNDEVQLDFAGLLPDELNKDAYILVAIDKGSKFPTAQFVRNTTADITINFMQRYISNNGYLDDLDETKLKHFEPKQIPFFTNNIKNNIPSGR